MNGVLENHAKSPGPAWVSSSRKVLLADSDPLFLRGLHVSLDGDFTVVGEVTTSEECLVSVPQAEILVMGFSLSCGRNALGLLPDLRLRHNGLAVIVFLSPTTAWMVPRLHAAGACGVLSRRTTPEEIPRLVRDAILGKPLPSLMSHLPREESTVGSVGISDLSARELEIFRLIGLEKSGKEIASILGISGKTVSAHRENIKTKLNLHGSRTLRLVAVSHANWEATGADFII